MVRSRTRVPSAIAALLLALAVVLAIGGGFAAPARAAGTDTSSSTDTSSTGLYTPIGRWQGTVTTATGATEPVTMVFDLFGRLTVHTPDGRFTGTWRTTGSRTFTYGFVRPLPAPDGTVIGSLDIRHSATFSSWNAFTSTGTATGYDLEGHLLFSAPVSSTATRS